MCSTGRKTWKCLRGGRRPFSTTAETAAVWCHLTGDRVLKWKIVTFGRHAAAESKSIPTVHSRSPWDEKHCSCLIPCHGHQPASYSGKEDRRSRDLHPLDLWSVSNHLRTGCKHCNSLVAGIGDRASDSQVEPRCWGPHGTYSTVGSEDRSQPPSLGRGDWLRSWRPQHFQSCLMG
jgi:hypothetical protein